MRRIVLTVFILLLPTALFPQHALQLQNSALLPDQDGRAPGFAFDIELDAGLLIGMLQEWVFIDREGNNAYDDVLSRLDWQQQPLWYCGATARIMPWPRWFFGIGAWLGIPGLTGFMEDRDWDAVTGVYEVFSHHDNFSEGAFFLDANAGYSLLYDRVLTLNALAGFNLKQFRMSGQNGWQERYDGLPAGGPYTGEVINFEMNLFIPYLGLEAAWNPVPLLTVNAMITLCPWLSFAYDRDIHRGFPDVVFQDLPMFGFFFSAVLNVVFHLGNGWDLRVKNLFMWTPPFKGRTYIGGFLDAGSRGGASLLLYGVSLSVACGLGL